MYACANEHVQQNVIQLYFLYANSSFLLNPLVHIHTLEVAQHLSDYSLYGNTIAFTIFGYIIIIGRN